MAETQSRILIVDDLPDWRATLSGLMADEGYNVQVADSLPSALNLLEVDNFDLAVLDMRLDETDEDNTGGLNLAAKIKNRWPMVKVVIITGYGTQEIMKQALEPDTQGQRLAENYVPKTETEDLIRVMQEALA